MTVAELSPRPATESALTEQQARDFVEKGYAVVPGLVPQAVIDQIHQRLRELYDLDVHDPATFRDRQIDGLIKGGPDHMDTGVAWTDEVEAVCRALIGPDATHGRAFVPIPRMPGAGPLAFEPMGYHIDGDRGGLTLAPVQRAMVLLIYLTDTDELGGATSIFPGSHRKVFEWGYKKGVDDEGRFTEPDTATPPPLDFGSPVAVPMKAGDVAFMHYLTMHGGSRNCRPHLRIALNGVARPPAETPYQFKQGAPTPDWTPLDYTLRTDNIA